MRRIATGLLIGGGWLLLLMYGPFRLFWVVISAAGAVGLYEYFQLVLRKEEKKFLPAVVLIGLLPLLAASAGRVDIIMAGLFLSVLLLVIFILIIFPSLINGLSSLSRISFGIVYIGFGAAHFVLLRALPEGVMWLLILTAVAVGSDTGAYYIGKSIGRRKLCPAVSPGKTRAGAIGGLVTGITAGLITARLISPAINLFTIAFIAFLLTCIGMVGDLTESVIKRSVGVKDSGGLLPGHGGLLDRGDSLLLSVPALFYLLYFGLPATG